MTTLNKNIKILFCFANPELVNIDEASLRYDYISESLYFKLGKICFNNNTDNELKQYYNQLFDKKYESFFDMLADFGQQTVDVSNGYPQVKFNKISEWYDVTHSLGQAIIITALMARKSLEYNIEYDFFAWPSNLKTDNRQLQHILNSGMAENHFHLNGSGEIFPITWISIMNNPSSVIQNVKNLNDNLFPRLSFGVNYNRKEWSELLFEAAKLRIKLFCKLHPEFISFMKENPLNIHKSIQNISYNIAQLNGYRDEKFGWTLDYALSKSLSINNLSNSRILVGERKFLFDCLKAIYSNRFDEELKKDFYKYILIKNNFRNEIIQSNNFIGFKNFSDYQKRKLNFIKGIKKYENEVFMSSINEVLSNKSVVSLEARIMPKKNEAKLLSCINHYDDLFKATNSRYTIDKKLPYFFVLHYPKRADDYVKKNNFDLLEYRNKNLRVTNKLYSQAIMKALETHPVLQERILGIDTCSNEIGCRPEVFATDYRYLKNFISKKTTNFWENSTTKHFSLGRTYHVGEDFLDIVDGLRAIDEVTKFLDFSYGDRLGHALALGVNPDEYYKAKGYNVVLPCIDLLDNLVWLCNKSNELNINIEPILRQNIELTIDELSDRIYSSFSKEHLEINVNLRTLYGSWQLRGDHPELYKNMCFEPLKYDFSHYSKAMYEEREPLSVLRKNKDCVYLYYAYHFDDSVKKEGRKSYAYSISPEYVSLVINIQKKMQFEISKLGIMIECNPSSNRMIGTFREYKNHPITTFNNLHLEMDLDKISNCPQISVSINTDDQGVFDTSLEYEYALMAHALMNIENNVGHRMYSPEQVYDYLNNVRKMGIIQSFKSIEQQFD